MVTVVAALIQTETGYLMGLRPPHKARGLTWEFVGGKVESGETRQKALVRECQEELGITLDVGDVFYQVDHVYPDITIHLTLFHATIAQGTPKLLEHNDLRWITVPEMGDYAFCPADTEILAQIRTRYGMGGADHG